MTQFDTEKFSKIQGATWNMDDQMDRLIIPTEKGFDALVGYRDSKTKKWLWIRRDFKK